MEKLTGHHRLPNAPTHYPTADAALPDARLGRAAAQRCVYNEHADALMMVCIRYLPRREDAEEAVMDAFVAAFKALPRFVPAGAGSLQAWLKKIAVNTCLMRIRHERTKPAVVDIEEYPVADNTTDGSDPLSQMSAREILAAVHDLPEGYRTVFNLYIFEGWSHAEIAASLGISESTSKTQLFKARRAMQTRLRATHSF